MSRADRGVQGGVRIAEGGGEDVGGREVGARDEARNLGLSGVVLSSGMNECGDRDVAASGLAQGAAGGVDGARRIVKVGGPSQRTPQSRDRVRGGIEPPQPGVVDLRSTKFGEPRASIPRTHALMNLEHSILDARVNAGGDVAWIFMRLRAGGCSSSEGDATSVPQRGGRIASSAPDRSSRSAIASPS